jgi:hypothetical protein
MVVEINVLFIRHFNRTKTVVITRIVVDV